MKSHAFAKTAAALLAIFFIASGQAVASCGIADDILGAKKTSTISGGWTYIDSECREKGIYQFVFKNKSGARVEAIMVLPPMTAYSQFGERRQLYVSNKSAEDKATRALRAEINRRADKWESGLKRSEGASGAAFILLMAGAVLLISKIYQKNASGAKTGLGDNIVFSAALLVFLLCAVELAMRALNIYPSDAGFMNFMKDVRQNRVQGGGYRRVDSGTERAEKSSDEYENSLGYRGGEFGPKSEGVARVACVGDSFMYGIGVEPGKTLPELLEGLLKKEGRKVEVLNYGVPGASTADEAVIALTETVVENPDIVVWGFVLNDVDFGSLGTEETYFDGVAIKYNSLENMLESHDPRGIRRHVRMYNYLAGAYEDRKLTNLVVRMYADGYDEKTNTNGLKKLEADMRLVSDAYRRRGVRMLMFIYPLLVDLQGQYPFEKAHRKVAEIARRSGVEVVDLLPEYKGRDEKKLWVSLTDHHPNGEGQMIAARAVAKALAERGLLDGPAAGIKSAVEGATEKHVYGDMLADILWRVLPGLESDPTSCDAHAEIAAAAVENGATRAFGAKVKRMRSLGPGCALEAAAISNKYKNSHDPSAGKNK